MNKTKSRPVFRLIKSLSPNEKRYFKLFCKMHAHEKENNYIRLFEVIDKQESYDEPAIKKIFHKESFIKRLDLVSNRLYYTILKSLDLFHADSSVDNHIRRHLNYVEILYKSGGADECLKILKSLKKMAYAHEKDILLLEIATWESLVLFVKTPINLASRFIPMFDEELKIVDRLNNSYHYQRLNSAFVLLAGKQNIKEMKKLIKHPLLKNEKMAISLNSERLYHHCYCTYYHIIKNYKKLYQHVKREKELDEKMPLLIKENPGHYCTTLNNFIASALLIGQYNEVIPGIRKMRTLPDFLSLNKRAVLQLRVFGYSYCLEMRFYIDTAQFRKALAIMPEIEQGIKQYGSKLSAKIKSDLYYFSSIVFLCTGKYKESLRCVNQIIHDSKHLPNPAIPRSAEIFNIIIHFELGNSEAIQYLVNTAKRTLKKNNNLGIPEKIILNTLGKISKISDTKSLLLFFNKLKNELKKYTNRKEPYIIENFDIYSWIESKIQKKPLEEIMKKKVNYPTEKKVALSIN